MIGSQRLRVESASAKGTVLTGIIKDNKEIIIFYSQIINFIMEITISIKNLTLYLMANVIIQK